MDYVNLMTQIKDIYLANDSVSWLLIVAVALILAVLVKAVLKVLSRRLRAFTEKTESIWDDVGLDVLDRIKPAFIFTILVYMAGKPLSLSPFGNRLLLIILVVVTIVQFWLAGNHLIKSWRDEVLRQKIQADPSSAAALGLLYSAIQILFLITIVLVGLSNLGVDIAALLAGLGVGGIAVALAAQNILGDLLASLSIVLDKPFTVGDYIVTGTNKGTIESIGIKTTRLRSLSGEELILSNKDLLESRVHNFKRMQQRRVVKQFGVTYDTPSEKLEQIPVWIREFIEANEKLKFDRCHFCHYGPSSLDYELVFFVLDPEYNVYMDLQQKLLIKIIDKFNAEGIRFAFPTQTIHVESPKAEA